MQTTKEQNLVPASSTPYKNTTQTNVAQVERWASGIVGTTLTTYGFIRRDWPGAALAALGTGLLYRALSGHSFLYQALDIVTAEKSPSVQSSIPGQGGMRIRRRITINRPAQELYDYWRDVEKAPYYMKGIQSVQQIDNTLSHWVARGPFGKSIEWTSEILQDEPGKLISWQAYGKTPSGQAGKVSFVPAPGSRGTIVTLELDFPRFASPLVTSLNTVIGKLPEHVAQQDLRQFKALMETGEIATIEGQPTGKGRK